MRVIRTGARYQQSRGQFVRPVADLADQPSSVMNIAEAHTRKGTWAANYGRLVAVLVLRQDKEI